MSESCGGCALDRKAKMSWKWFGSAVVGGLLLALGLTLSMKQPALAKTACMTREQVSAAVEDMGKCLTIYNGGVYDFTIAKRWDLTGHVDKHMCGQEYDKATIEEGPHLVDVMEPFYSTSVCGESTSRVEESGSNLVQKINAEIREKTGMGLFRWSSYISLVLFLLNFLTCYAMPWSRVRQPWEGSIPGHDDKDISGRFPLTYWHKQFAWLAILFLAFHAALGFGCIWFNICF